MSASRRDALHRLFAALQAYERLFQFRDSEQAGLSNLRVNECYVLDLLVTDGPLSVSDIAARLGVHKSNASRVARSLQSKGWVKERKDPDDARCILWSPTSNGRQKHSAVTNTLVNRFNDVLANLKVKEINSVVRTLSLLAADIEDRGKDQRACD